MSLPAIVARKERPIIGDQHRHTVAHSHPTKGTALTHLIAGTAGGKQKQRTVQLTKNGAGKS